MTLNLSMPGQGDLKPRITVFGVGGAGGNAVNNMIEKELDGVDFVVANTDAQALQQAKAESRVQLGIKVTEGLGAGARASVGAAAAEESIEQIVDHLAGAHMCFITAGMGGGTGTGAAPIIAQAARELGVLTVGVVTKPFQFEGGKRMKQAEDGVEALQKVVDTLIIIPNQNLFRLANENTTFTEAFALADDVLYQGVKGVTDLMVRPGLINLDFADVRAVMDEMGKAMMGTGEADGENRAVEAAEKAMDRLSNIQTDDVRGTAASQIELLSRFYDLSLSQAQRSFRWALIAGVVGFTFLLGAIIMMWADNRDFSMVTLASGVIIEFIATINFYIYNKSLTQLTLFQGRLEITQRFLLANSLCESLGDELRDTTRAELIRKLSSTHAMEPAEPPIHHRRGA